MSDSPEEQANEFATAFKKISEFEGIIIRGHILIEQALNNTIELTILEKNEYDPDRFSFNQKLILANMLGISTDYKIALNALNRVRNQIAHSLKFDETYINIIIEEVKKKNAKIFEGNDSKLSSLVTAISFICGAISNSHQFARLKTLLQQLKSIPKA